jgi:hypothetical protein
MGTIQTASNIKGDITCVFGNTKTGRTKQIIDRVLARPETDKVLWVSFNNINFEGRERPTWVVAQMESWEAFNTQVFTPLKKGTFMIDGEVFTPNIIVLEGLEIVGQYYYTERMLKMEAKYAQQVFGEVGPKLREIIAVCKSKCDALFFSLTTRDKVELGGTATVVFATNDDSVQKTLTMASKLVYTSIRTKRNDKGVVQGQAYFVQNNSSLATQFIQGQEA